MKQIELANIYVQVINLLMTFRPEPKVTKDKSNRKKCYLDILGAVFRTEKSAVNHPRGLCMSLSVYDVPCRRKTSSVPLSSGFFTPPLT